MTSENVATITKLIGLLNARDGRASEYMDEVFSDKITGKFFSTNTATWRIVENKEEAVRAFLASSNPDNDVIWSPMDIYDLGSKVIWEGFWVGSEWKTATGVSLTENFKLPIMSIWELKDGKIINFEYFTDTLEMVKLAAKALIREGDSKKIQQYVSNLVDLGMLPEIILSLFF